MIIHRGKSVLTVTLYMQYIINQRKGCGNIIAYFYLLQKKKDEREYRNRKYDKLSLLSSYSVIASPPNFKCESLLLVNEVIESLH